MEQTELKVGLSTLVKLNKQINANTADIAMLKAAGKAPPASKKKAPAKKKAPSRKK